MAQLRRDYSKFQEADAALVVVGPEGPEAFEAYWTKNDLPFIGLPDPDSLGAQALWPADQAVQDGPDACAGAGGQERDRPLRHYGHDMTDIPSNDDLLGLLASMVTARTAAAAYLNAGCRE